MFILYKVSYVHNMFGFGQEHSFPIFKKYLFGCEVLISSTLARTRAKECPEKTALILSVFRRKQGRGVGVPRVQVLAQSRSFSFEGDSDSGPYLSHLDFCVILLQST